MEAERQLMVARVGALSIGVPATAVARVLPMLPLWRPPTLPPVLAGFVTIDGAALPVLDAGLLLGVAGVGAALYAHILELRIDGARATGLLVDRAEGMAMPATLEAIAPDRSLNGCAEALFHHRDGEIAHLLAPDRLLGRAERVMLDALTDEAERRRAEWERAA